MLKKLLSVLSITMLVGVSFIYLPPVANAASETISCNVGGSRTITQGTYIDSDGTQFTAGADLTLNVGTGGSCSFTFNGTMTLASLTIESGVTLTHSDNSTTQTNTLVINTSGDIDIQSGAYINVDYLGYDGGVTYTTGKGPGAGPGTGGNVGGGGGGHAGEGGDGRNFAGNPGGVTYCDITDLDTMGSGGGGGSASSTGGAGGGLIKLNAGGTISIDGVLTADGAAPVGGYSGGGAGGGISLIADSIDGAGTITATGGIPASGTRGGGGGGGCVYLEYTTSNSFSNSSITYNGGVPAGSATGQDGGSGMLLVKQTGDDGDMYLKGVTSDIAPTTQSISALSLDTITLDTYANYYLDSGDNLTINSADPFGGSNGTGGSLTSDGSLNMASTTNINDIILNINGAYTNNPNLSIASGADLEIGSSAVLSSTISTLSTAGNMTLNYSESLTIDSLNITAGYVSLDGYSTSNGLTLDDLTITGGYLTHGDNNSAQTNIINLTATNVTIGASGSIDADGKGYAGGVTYTTGKGPGPGIGSGGNASGGGGAHCGNGGSADNAGGTAYCDIGTALSMGSGGGGGSSSSIGGDGGGLIYMNISGILDLDGTITADGTAGSGGGYRGAGAGGGINITVNSITGSGTMTATGRASSAQGGGGGGFIKVTYGSTTIVEGNLNVAGGGIGTEGAAGGIGTLSYEMSNTEPFISTALAAVNQETDGSGVYNFTVSVDDAEDNDIDLQVECGDGDFASTIDIDSTNLGSVNNGAATYKITGISTAAGAADVEFAVDTKSALDDIDTSTFQCRVTPYDGTDTGTSSEVTGLDLDNLDPDPNADATIALITDLNSDGVAAIGDTMQLTAGTENTGDTVTWQLNLTPITGQATLASGIESDPIIAGVLEFEDIPVNFNVVDDMGNEADAVTANSVTLDQVLPVFTDNGTLSISTDNNSDGIAGISDGLTLSGVTLDASDNDVITIDYDTVGGLFRVLMDSEGIVGSGAVDGATTFNITAMDDAGNTATTTSDAINVYNVAHTVEFDITSSTVSETEGDTDITVVLDAVSVVDVTVDYTVTGTATHTEDFTLVDGTVTIDAGNASADINIPLIDDGDVEDDETIILTLSNPGEATLDTNTVHTITVTSDDNTPPTISTALADDDQGLGAGAQANDGSGHYYFTFSVDDAEYDNVDVQVECGDSSYADIDIISVSLGTIDNDAATYQITGIDTSSGAVDLELVIDTQSTLDDTRTSSFQCRVTPFDSTDTGTASAVTGLTMDNEDPVIDDAGIVTLETDNNGNGIVNVGDEVAYAAGSVSNTEDINNWSIDGTGFVEFPSYILAGGGNRTVIEGSIDDATHTFTVTVYDDFGNTSTATSNSLNIDNEPPVITDSGTVTITTDTNSNGVANAGDGLTLAGVTLNSDDDDVITIDFGEAGGLDEVLMGAEDFLAPGSIDDDFNFNIDVTDDAGNTTSTTSNSITVFTGSLSSSNTSTQTGSRIHVPKDNSENNLDNRNYPNLENHWAKEQLTELINKGVVDKNVEPDVFIDREEAVRIVLEAENIDFEGSAIEAALELGIIEQERPEDPATRAEILKIIFNTIKLRYFGSNPSSHFNDVFLGDWYFVLINFAFEKAIVQGYPDGSFKPNQIITAAEVAVLLSKTLDVVE